MITKKIQIPTGYLLVGDYSRGQLETLSIGDYGKGKNVKADFLGYTNIIEGVPNGTCMPLTEKWVITVSTQYGCPMKCTFCDVPNLQFKGNASVEDLKNQLYSAIAMFPNIRYTERLNLHYARMGEPAFNMNVFEFSRWLAANKRQLLIDTGLRVEVIHPVLTSSMPRALGDLGDRIREWCDIKNNVYNGQAGLQFSINSTNDDQRNAMFNNRALSLDEIAIIAESLPDPVSRKYCLNFAYSTDFEIDAEKLANMFDPNKFMCKITPIHNNNACTSNNIKTLGGYDSWMPYQKPEEDLKAAGFDVLVFVPSMDEENGLVTCGNAVLGGGTLKLTDNTIKIEGI
jgi:23S rRNA (adenine2503-C2)-methyltransferase